MWGMSETFSRPRCYYGFVLWVEWKQGMVWVQGTRRYFQRTSPHGGGWAENGAKIALAGPKRTTTTLKWLRLLSFWPRMMPWGSTEWKRPVGLMAATYNNHNTRPWYVPKRAFWRLRPVSTILPTHTLPNTPRFCSKWPGELLE